MTGFQNCCFNLWTAISQHVIDRPNPNQLIEDGITHSIACPLFRSNRDGICRDWFCDDAVHRPYHVHQDASGVCQHGRGRRRRARGWKKECVSYVRQLLWAHWIEGVISTYCLRVLVSRVGIVATKEMDDDILGAVIASKTTIGVCQDSLR